ncbi:hypothetical protein LIA77_10755 [Sarocladium implicatum]|nr:hypothetical protein LIA77_10755 [Sarocladium implicatum]
MGAAPDGPPRGASHRVTLWDASSRYLKTRPSSSFLALTLGPGRPLWDLARPVGRAEHPKRSWTMLMVVEDIVMIRPWENNVSFSVLKHTALVHPGEAERMTVCQLAGDWQPQQLNVIPAREKPSGLLVASRGPRRTRTGATARPGQLCTMGSFSAERVCMRLDLRLC